MQGQALPGFRDFYPDELALRNHIFATWREIARRYGVREQDAPPLEPLELYTDKSGEEIVQQLYAFDNKGGRKVALRPEMTPTLARMVGAHAQALKKPIRWFSIPQLFRYERQQRGRLREHFQLNMDILGEASPLADAELIAAAIDIMRAFGLGPRDVQVRMSDRRVLRTLLLGRGVSEGQLGAAFAAIDKSERDPKDVLAAKLRESGVGKRETDAVFEIAALRELDAVLTALGKVQGGEESGEPLRQAVGALEAMGLGDFVAVDLTIVRGLAYYTGIVFELFDTGKSLRAVCGGGRYDGLLKALGGPGGGPGRWSCGTGRPARKSGCPSRSSLKDRSTNGPSAEDHATRQGLQRVVQRRRHAGRAGGPLAGTRLHGHPAPRLPPVGTDAARPGRHVQGHGPPERLLPAVHPDELSRQGSRACRGLRQGSRAGDAHPAEGHWQGGRPGADARSRVGARGAARGAA